MELPSKRLLLLFLTQGQWRWSPWSDCSVTCGDGQQRRTGTCISPSTGKILVSQLCAGENNETRHCNNGECPGKPHIRDNHT